MSVFFLSDFFPAVFYTEVKFEETEKKRGKGVFLFCFAWTFGEQLLSLLNQSHGLEIDARGGPILEGRGRVCGLLLSVAVPFC